MRHKRLSVADVISDLRSTLGWEPEYSDEFYQDILDAGFNRATAREAFVLAQIVEDLGPISVRGAMYRGQSAGIFADTSDTFYNKTQRIILKLRRKGVIGY